MWSGFVVFNSSSVIIITDNYVAAGRCLINTLLAGCTGGLTMLIISRLTTSHYSVLDVLNGVLAGLVGICSSCSVVLPYASVITGSVCSIVFFVGEKAMARFEMDDPVSATSLHLGAGVAGLLLTGFTAYPPYLRDAFPGRDSYPAGLFHGGDSPGVLLGAQVVATISIIALVVVLLTPVLVGLKLGGVLTYTDEEQLMGADEAIHGGAAYNFAAEETSADLLTTWQSSSPQMTPRQPVHEAITSWTSGDAANRKEEGPAKQGRLDTSSSFSATKSSNNAKDDDVGCPRFASFVVTTDSGHRSTIRQQHVGSASSLGLPATRRESGRVSLIDDPEELIETVAPVSTNSRTSF